MRHYDTSCGPMSCVPTREDGVPQFVIKHLYVTRYAKTNHNYAKKIIFLNGFRIIFVGSIIVANLK